MVWAPDSFSEPRSLYAADALMCMYDASFQCAFFFHKFTGKERDSESGLDEFGARYYASSLGRFMIPDWAAAPTDVPYANFGNPQSLNLYSYVENNPTTTGDPDGHCCSDWADWVDSKVQVARDYYAANPGTDSPAWAATKTFLSGVAEDVTSGAGDVLRLGTGVPAAVDAAQKGNYLAAVSDLAQDGGRVGQVILGVTGVAAKVSPAINAQEVSAKAGTNSVETSAGRVDLQGEGHYSKAAGQAVNTPHVHENASNTNPASGQTFPYQQKVPRPATNADVSAAAKAAGVRVTPKPLPIKTKPEQQ